MNAFLSWTILLAPLTAAVLIGLFTKQNPKLSSRLSIGAIGLGFLSTLLLAAGNSGTPADPITSTVTWLEVGGLKVDLGMTIDPLSMMMLFVVTGVGTAIHIFSLGYMKEDPSQGRYFGLLSLFTFSMLGIVLASNFFQMFIFWELVGVSSYLLIGFWFERDPAAAACQKAFIVNRLGDFGFLLGIILIWSVTGSLSFAEISEVFKSNPQAMGGAAVVAGLLIFCGVLGKSAQFPLHVWLPDAMEGPTPVSALIHAATMVAAGVYLLCRTLFLFELPAVWPSSFAWLNGISSLHIVAITGAVTSLMAALIATRQDDIKRILAYSTLSQLGYMVMAVGLGGAAAGMFHLTTHAFFKALLFLGAGSVIYASHHEQDIWKLGGLRKKMPVTFWTFLIGTLALCGAPPFSGFYSKEEILLAAYQSNVVLFTIAAFTAVLTTFYMFRLVFVAFGGQSRSDSADHAHESPSVMTSPLVFLAVLSILGGWLGIGGYFGHFFSHGVDLHGSHHESQTLVMFIGVGAIIFGFFPAYFMYHGAKVDPMTQVLGSVGVFFRNRMKFDEAYAWLIDHTHEALARLAEWFDRWILAGFVVKGIQFTGEFTGRALRLAQTGNTQTYIFLFGLGLAVALFAILL